MSARILTVDIETQRAIVETFDLWPRYIGIDRVHTPTRVLCFAAKFHDEERVRFHAAWEDGDSAAYEKMIRTAWGLFDEADVVVSWNGDRFDVQYLNAAFGILGLGPPSPYRSLDLIKTVKKNFAKGELSMKLDWYAQRWLGDKKTNHGGADLWHDIRYGTRAERRAAQKVMREYNIHDVELTERLFDKFLPWTGVNFALYDEDNAARFVCTHCESTNLQKRGTAYTTAYSYPRYYCNDCKGWSKGRRMYYTTELRPV